MNIVFGSSSFNRICFASEDHKAVARLMKDGTIDVKVSRIRKSEKKAIGLVMDIPFVRGIAMVMRAILSNKILSILFSGLLIYEIFFRLPPLFPPKPMNIMLDAGKALCVMLAGALAVRPWLGKFHAAEHMAAEAYRNDRELTVESVMKEKRTSIRCGSIFAVIYFLLFIAASVLFPGLSRLLIVIACISISFELTGLDDHNVLLKPFTAIGLFIQKYILTAQPEERHLNVSHAALLALKEQSMRKKI